MNLFRDLERVIDEKLRGLFPVQKRELIEIQRAILDEIADRAQSLPRARRVLAANQITVTVPAPEEDRRTAFRLVFVEGDALEHDLKAHLRRESIEFPANLKVSIDLIDEPVPDFSEKGFHVVLANRETADKTEPAANTVSFTLPNGSTIEVNKARIHIGRTPEVMDDRRRLVRRNDLAIDEQTVSRAHAHIEFDRSAGTFRLFDDGSSYGTSVVHDGRLVEVAKAGARGQTLRDGDEIYIGQTKVTFHRR
jgi:hypothetical protein